MNYQKSCQLLGDLAVSSQLLTKEDLHKLNDINEDTHLSFASEMRVQFELKDFDVRALLLNHMVGVFEQNQVCFGRLIFEHGLVNHQLLGEALDYPNDARLLLVELLDQISSFSPERLQSLKQLQALLFHRLQIQNQSEKKCPGCGKEISKDVLVSHAEWKCENCFCKFNISGLLSDLPIEVITEIFENKKADELISLSGKETIAEDTVQNISSTTNETVDVTFFSSKEFDDESLTSSSLSNHTATPPSLRSYLIRNNLTPNADLLSGDTLDEIKGNIARYAIGKEIGRGGMGSILKTKDLDTRRNIVTKVMHRKTSKKGILRFIEEAQVTAQLEHPNIVPVYDLGINAEGNVFYTMKHVKGRSLQDIINGLYKKDNSTLEKFPSRRLIDILLRVCNAVAYAHSQHVIHRDLKPENIMVGDYGEVLLMDFGLAKILSHRQGREGLEKNESLDLITSDRNEQDDMATIEGDITGTPKYMAPEQAHGLASQMDEKTDLYALGGILHACFAFEPPVGGDKLNEVIKNVQEGNRLPLPESTPPEIKAIISKAMAVEQQDRYASVNDFAKDLGRFQNGYQVSVKSDNPLVVLSKLIKRNKSIFTTISVALFFLIAFGVYSFQRIVDEKDEAKNNLRLFLDEKAVVSHMRKEREKPWKTFYKASFDKVFEPHRIKGRPKDYGFGPWAIHKAIGESDQSNDILTVKLKNNTKIGIKNNRLHFSSDVDRYCYLNKPVSGNLRLEVGVEIVQGYWPEATFFICGSKEKQELDGYSMIIGRSLKFQRKGNMILTFPLTKLVKPGMRVKVLFEKVDNVLKGYINDLDNPIFIWEDPEPLYGKKHEICGLYVWRGEIAIDSFKIIKQRLAKRNTPLDFVNSIQDKGHFQYAIDEYYEIIFSSDDEKEKAQSYFNIGIALKKSNQPKRAREIFNQFITQDNAKVNGQLIDFTKPKKLKEKAYIYNLLLSIDKDFDLLDENLSNWPSVLKHDYDEVLVHSRSQPAMLIIFNYLIARKIRMYNDIKESKKAIKFMELLFRNMSPASKEKCKKSFSDYIYMVGLRKGSKKDFELTEKYMSKAIFYNDSDSRFYYNRGEVRMALFLANSDKTKLNEAMADFKKVIELAPTERRGYLVVSGIYLRQKKIGKAKEILQSGLKVLPKSGLIYSYLGDIHRDHNEDEQAEVLFKKGMDVEPSMTMNHMGLGLIYLKRNELKQVKKLVDLALRDGKGYYESYALAGKYEAQLGNNLKAIKLFLKAYSVDDRYEWLLVDVYKLYKKEGLHQKAMEIIQYGIAQKGDVNLFLILEVHCLITLNKKEEALKKYLMLKKKLKHSKKYDKRLLMLKKQLEPQPEKGDDGEPL